jgi:hypothetical protein
MIKDVFHSIGSAARKLFANWGALLISLLLYAALLGAVYLFFTIREATNLQVALNVVLPMAAIALFFLIQAMGLSYVRIGVGAGYLLKRALKDCWKILLASLPLILLAWLIIYLFGKVDQTFFSESLTIESKARAWGAIALHATQIFLLHVFLPLIAIHLWIATVREGLGAAFKGFGRSVIRAFAPRSLLIYALVCAVFGAIVYFLLFKKVTFKGEWAELWAVGIKTALALLMVFIGWLLTLGSMAEMTTRRAMSESEA